MSKALSSNRDRLLTAFCVGSAAALAVYYWALPRYWTVSSQSQRLFAIILGLLAVVGGGVWMFLMTTPAMKMQMRQNNLSPSASLLGPLGAVQFLSGVTSLFWAGHLSTPAQAAAGAAGSTLILSAILQLRQVIKNR